MAYTVLSSEPGAGHLILAVGSEHASGARSKEQEKCSWSISVVIFP
jgi:hypothetical protein